MTKNMLHIIYSQIMFNELSYSLCAELINLVNTGVKRTFLNVERMKFVENKLTSELEIKVYIIK